MKLDMPNNKVTILKRNENGKLKSLLVFNAANEQARLYFTEDEKLDRVVVGNDKENIVAWDRVGEHYVVSPLTDKFRLDTNGDGRFWCYLKDPKRQPGTERCFITAEASGNLSIQNAKGVTGVEIDLGKDGKFLGFINRGYGPYEVVEHNTTSEVPAPQQQGTLLQKALDDRRSR